MGDRGVGGAKNIVVPRPKKSLFEKILITF